MNDTEFDKENLTIMFEVINAIEAEDCETITCLIKTNPDQKQAYTFLAGATHIGYAACEGKLTALKCLVDLGLDINAGARDYGHKPICNAADENNVDVVKYLLDQGAELDVDLSVKNPLFAAIVGRSPEIVQLLLEHGIDSTVIYNSDTMTNMNAEAFARMRGESGFADIIAAWNKQA